MQSNEPLNDVQFYVNENTRWHFAYLPWDSEFFQLPCYKLSIHSLSGEEVDKLYRKSFKEIPDGFITAKVSCHEDVINLKILQECGFRYIDTELLLQANRRDLDPAILHPSLSFKELNCVSENDLDFNAQVFAHSRFHQDPRISSKQADELWNQYLKNFKVSSNQKAFCATQAEEKLGLILTQLNFETREACLFYVAVKPNSRGLGIGSFLVNNTLKVLNDFNCFTEVYCRNLKALNFYLGNGLNMIKSTQSVLHRWAK